MAKIIGPIVIGIYAIVTIGLVLKIIFDALKDIYITFGDHKKFFHDRLGIHVPADKDIQVGESTICKYCSHPMTYLGNDKFLMF